MPNGMKVRFTKTRLAFRRWYDKDMDCWMAEVEAEELDNLRLEVERLGRLVAKLTMIIGPEKLEKQIRGAVEEE